MAKEKSEARKVLDAGNDKLGREVTRYSENGKHYVEANRNGAVHPVKCESEKEAKALYEKECAVE